jgi:hypothetical protein
VAALALSAVGVHWLNDDLGSGVIMAYSYPAPDAKRMGSIANCDFIFSTALKVLGNSALTVINTGNENRGKFVQRRNGFGPLRIIQRYSNDYWFLIIYPSEIHFPRKNFPGTSPTDAFRKAVNRGGDIVAGLEINSICIKPSGDSRQISNVCQDEIKLQSHSVCVPCDTAVMRQHYRYPRSLFGSHLTDLLMGGYRLVSEGTHLSFASICNALRSPRLTLTGQSKAVGSNGLLLSRDSKVMSIDPRVVHGVELSTHDIPLEKSGPKLAQSNKSKYASDEGEAARPIRYALGMVGLWGIGGGLWASISAAFAAFALPVRWSRLIVYGTLAAILTLGGFLAFAVA